MSNEDKSRKTEQPTRKKLRDARERGQVARSKEIVLVALAVAMSIALWTMWDGILDRCLALIALPADYYAVDFDTALTHLTATIFTLLAELLVPLALLVLIIAVLFNVLQFGFLFTVEPIIPRLSKINPIEGVKRLVSVKSLIDFLLSLAKTGLIIAAVGFVAAFTLSAVVQMPHCGLACTMGVSGELFIWLMLLVIPPLAALSLVDLSFQRSQHVKDNMMTKEEAKRRHKDEQGDPLIKSRRRQMAREMAADDPVRVMEMATAVVRSGGLAAVLYFDAKRTPLPVVLALGKGEMTKVLLQVAKQAEVPIVEHRLAQSLAGVGRVAPFAVPGALIKAANLVIRQARAGVETKKAAAD